MDHYVDTTSLVYPAVSWAYVAPFEPAKNSHERRGDRTEFATGKGFVDLFTPVRGPHAPTDLLSGRKDISQRTPTVHEMAAPSRQPFVANLRQTNPDNPDVEKISKQRVRLMAAKYAGGPENSEITARLEILNRRLLERAPRVSEVQVMALEKTNERLIQIRLAREERSKRFGISL